MNAGLWRWKVAYVHTFPGWTSCGESKAAISVLRRHGFVTMVQPTANWKRRKAGGSMPHPGFLGAYGGVTVESLVGSPGMVVLLNVFSEQTVQVPFTEHDDVIEQLSAYCAEKLSI